jgi:hypothetical protein
MSRYLEIARAAMREQGADVSEPDPVDSRCGYEINEKRTAESAPPSRSDVPGPELTRNRWSEQARPPMPLRRCGALICRTCHVHSPSSHCEGCEVVRFDPCLSRWFWLSSHGAIKCVACAAPADLGLVEAWVLARETGEGDDGWWIPGEILSLLHVTGPPQ